MFDGVLSSFWSALNLRPVAINVRSLALPTLWVFVSFWVFISPLIDYVNFVSVDDQQISLELLLLGRKHLFTLVYIFVIYQRCRRNWDFLSSTAAPNALPWFVWEISMLY